MFFFLAICSWAEIQVGEWEVRHALRQSEEELRGKDLASREKIEELLVTVRQSAATTENRRAITPERRRKDDAVYPGQFPQGASLDAFFSLTGDEDGARGGVDEDSSATPSAKVDSPLADAAAALEMVPSRGNILDGTLGRTDGETTRGEQLDAAGGGGETPQQQHAGRNFKLDMRSAERERAPPRTMTEQDEPATSTTAGAGGSSSASPVPGPKLIRKKKPTTIGISPELSALFHTPLLVPRHLDPPIAGSAAAAVMAGGGARRVKQGAGDAVVR